MSSLIIKVILIFKLVFVSVQHEVNFPKDLDVNVQFPPASQGQKGTVIGHLRPLGWQNPSSGQVDEESVIIKPEEFWDQYITPKKTVVIRGLLSASHITDLWTDSYLKREYGNLEIKVTKKKNCNDMDNHKVIFKDFLEKYRHDDLFLKVIMPAVMQKDASIPNILNCGPFTNLYRSSSSMNNRTKLAQLTEPFIWMSVGETSSLIQSYPEHELHCVHEGRKDFILIPTEQFETTKTWQKDLGLKETFVNSGEWFSNINVDMVAYFIIKKTSIINKLIRFFLR